jgi:3'(2'), 5'-bisphosphate nucleotidase
MEQSEEITLFESELQAATSAVIEAGALVLDFYSRLPAVPDATYDITTEADLAVQEILLERLTAAFPDDAFLCEEDTPLARQAKTRGRRLWMIDPIDGTRGFAKKTDEFAVMAGLVVDREPVVGVILEPVRGVLTRAAIGSGCETASKGEFTSFSPSRVSTIDRLGGATLAVSSSRRSTEAGKLAKRKGCASVIFSYSTGIKMAMIARGEADLYVTSKQKTWDVVPGTVIVEQAGGVISPDPRSLDCWPDSCDILPRMHVGNPALLGNLPERQ